jgi:hypothetical protein
MKKTVIPICIVAVAMFTGSYAVKQTAIDSDFWWSFRHPSVALVLATSTNMDERMKAAFSVLDDPSPQMVRQGQMLEQMLKH